MGSFLELLSIQTDSALPVLPSEPLYCRVWLLTSATALLWWYRLYSLVFAQGMNSMSESFIPWQHWGVGWFLKERQGSVLPVSWKEDLALQGPTNLTDIPSNFSEMVSAKLQRIEFAFTIILCIKHPAGISKVLSLVSLVRMEGSKRHCICLLHLRSPCCLIQQQLALLWHVWHEVFCTGNEEVSGMVKVATASRSPRMKGFYCTWDLFHALPVLLSKDIVCFT